MHAKEIWEVREADDTGGEDTSCRVCIHPGCGEDFPQARYDLGYRTCLRHGGKPNEYTVAPAYSKGGYQLITAQNVKDIGRAK